MIKQVIALLIVMLIGVSLLPVQQADTPTFANPAFQDRWAEQSAGGDGIDLWGSEPLAWRVEPYAGTADGRRIVQYFDRGRMELTPLIAGQGMPEVTAGLLARELTTGTIQLGHSLLESRPAPDMPIDSGSPDDRVPTYAALSSVVQQRAPAQTRESTMTVMWIDSRGEPYAGPPVVDLQATEYVPQTGHNIPDVTATFFARNPFGSESWIEALGYPISEPYWTTYRRDGTALPSLIQVFERRILVYTPAMPAERRFTVTNTGRHYYRWRYGSDPPREWPNPKAGPTEPNVIVPPGFEAGVYLSGIGTPVGLAIGPNGALWVTTAEGDVYRVDDEASDGSAEHVTLFAQDLLNPRGIALDGTAVYVAVDDGVVQLDDHDLNGVAERVTYLTQEIAPAAGPRGAPVVDAQGRVFVAGTRVPGGTEQVVGQILPDGTLVPTGVSATNPGPVTIAHQQLFVLDRSVDGEVALYRGPIVDTPLASQDQLGVIPYRFVAKFSDDSIVNAVLYFDSGMWAQVEPDTLLAAVTRGGSGSIVRGVSGLNGQPPELVEFATGLINPVAMVVGLDGSLFVADAGRGEVVKIVVPAANP